VYDRRAGAVTHFVDGVAVGSEAIVDRVLLRVGEAEIGNWGSPFAGSAAPIRNLCGRMDEFTLFREALGPTQVRNLFERGIPDP